MLEEVLSLKGVDMVHWGASDYSMGIGRAGERYSPDLRVVERRVRLAARHGDRVTWVRGKNSSVRG